MNWFEEQIEARRKYEREALNDAYEATINAITGESFSFEESEDELNTILRYYKLHSVSIPDDISDENEKLACMCRLSGLMQRPVTLEQGWYKSAFGAFLCKIRETGEYVAVLPTKLQSYSYYDKKRHIRVKLNKKTESLLDTEAICFYKPLPSEKLSVLDLLKYAMSAWSVRDYAMTFILMGISTFIGLLTPQLNYFLYNYVPAQGSISLMISTVVFLLSISVTTLLITLMNSVFQSRSQMKVNTAVRSASMMRVLSLPTSFFRQYSTGEISSRMSYLESSCNKIITMAFSTTVSSLFSLAYITQIFRYTPSLVLPALIIIALNLAFSTYSTFRQMKYSKKLMELETASNSQSIEIISGIQKIKVTGSEKRIFAKFATRFSEVAKIEYNPPFFNKYHTIVTTAIGILGTMTFYFIAAKNNVNTAEYYAFQSSYGAISAALGSLLGVALSIADLRPSFEMIKPILETVPENNEKAQDVTSLSGNIELDSVSFRYNESQENILDKFSLKIKAGQYVAIVGKTGCGKSTLVRLLLGFEKPQSGSIYYDGRSLSMLEKRSLRRKIGTVMQDDKLFTGDIYSNIVICAPTLSLDKAWEAAETAGIAEDIRQMPMGMFTMISEGSGTISGGQRQRLAIARAIAPKPKILIFDEATSALDNITQRKISESLDALNCTRIVIAHRLSTIRHCDRIIVIDKGHIVEDGTYDELVAKDGFFADLVERQRLEH